MGYAKLKVKYQMKYNLRKPIRCAVCGKALTYAAKLGLCQIDADRERSLNRSQQLKWKKQEKFYQKK